MNIAHNTLKLFVAAAIVPATIHVLGITGLYYAAAGALGLGLYTLFHQIFLPSAR